MTILTREQVDAAMIRCSEFDDSRSALDRVELAITARAYHDLRDDMLALADDQGPGTSYLVVGYQRRIREVVARVERGEAF